MKEKEINVCIADTLLKSLYQYDHHEQIYNPNKQTQLTAL